MPRQACFRRLGGTTKAYLLYPPEVKHLAFWIPRSVLTHVSLIKKANLPDEPHELIQITVEDWWVEKNPKLDKYFS